MRTLAVCEQGTEVSLRGESLLLSLGGKEARRVSLQDVGQVLLMGSVELTSGARRELLRRGVDVVFFTAAGRYTGRLVGAMAGKAALRREQYRKLSDDSFRLAVAAAIVRGKLFNQRRVLMKARSEEPEMGDVLAEMRLSMDRAAQARSLDELRGVEGHAAAMYWKGFGMLVRHPELRFERRTYRPPEDEINAMLSFGYTFLGVIQESHVLRVGLDPYLGCLHEVHPNRPSLSLDLIEEFRPVAVDALVPAMVNRREVAAEDFVRSGRGRPEGEELEGWEFEAGEEKAREVEAVYLGEAGRKIFLRAFFERMRQATRRSGGAERVTLRDAMLEQVYALARVVEGRAEGYEPFLWGS